MKLFKAVLPLFLLSLAWGQGVRFGDGNPPLTTHSILGVTNVVSTLPGATINVCNFPANGVPCTNKATTYTSNTLTTACSTSTQLTRASGSACFAQTDASGNWGVWLNPGLYAYTITMQGHSVGPIPFTAGSSSGGGGGAWGTITGSLSAQADLVAALALKANTTDLALKADLVHTHAATDITSGILSPSRLPPPTSNTLGGVSGTGTNLTCDSGFVTNGFNSDGTISCTLDQTGGGSYVLPALQNGTLGGVKGTGASLTCPANNHADGFQADGTLNCKVDPVLSVAAKTGAVTLVEADIASLVTDLAGKAAASHTHTESQVTNLVTDLAGKAALSHTHAESDVTNLVTDLAAKALDSNTVHKTGIETIAGAKTFSVPMNILTLATGCLNITAGLVGSTGTVCGSGGGGAWGGITGTLSSQTDLQNALNLKADDSNTVHKTLTETITGDKTFGNVFLTGFLQIAGGFEITSDWPVGAMTASAVNTTKVGVDSDGHFKTCESGAACVAPAVDSAVVHNTGTENVSGVKTFLTGVKVSGISDGCLNIASGVVGGSGSACGGSGGYTNLFQTSANVLTQRNSTTTQLYQVIDSYTDASNYQGLELNGFGLNTTWLGTGNPHAFQFGIKTAAGTIRGWQISTGQDLIPWNNTSAPNIAASGARMGTIFATVYNTPLADGCVQIGSNVMGTLGVACATTPNDLTVRTYAVGGGTAQAQTATLSPAATAMTAGLTVRWLPLAANTSGGPTLAVSGLTATTIKKCGATALVASDLNTTTVAQATYDGSAWELINPQVGACGTSSGNIADTAGNGIVVRTGAGTAINRSISAAAGLTGSNLDGVAGNPTISTDSTEADFLASGALTCGAATQGKIKVHTTPLQYCDNAATPTLQYSAYGDSTGNALTGDSATAFFSSGTFDTARLPTALANQTSINGLNIAASTGTLTLTGAKTLTISNSLTFAGTDATTQTFQATDTIVGRATTDTLTNKTLDAEGTGNVVTLPMKVWLPGAGCNNATASSFWDLPASTPAVATCVTGTNTQKGVLAYADTSGGFSAQNELLLPEDFSGTVDASIIWSTSATSGNAKWSLSTICTAVGATETDDPAFNTASTVTTAAPGTANRLQTSTITTVTITGCAAGEFMHVKVFRDGNDGSDTIAATANLLGVQLTIRRAM